MKKVLLAFLSLLMLLSFSGCDGGNSGGNPKEKLLKQLEANSWFCDGDKSLYLSFNAEKKTADRAISHTSFYLVGEIKDIRESGENSYEIDLFHQARHDEEMDYDEYNETLKIEYDFNDPETLIVTFVTGQEEDGPYQLHTDKGLSEEQLLKALEANGPYADTEHYTIAIFDATGKTITERNVVNYSTYSDEIIKIQSVVYKGFSYYDINFETEGQTMTLPICFIEEEPDYFYTLTEDPMFFAKDHGMDAANLINYLVGGNIYEDEYHDISVIFDNSLGHIIVKNKPDNLAGEFGILQLDYVGCNHYRYLVEDIESGAHYNIYLRLSSDGSKIGMHFTEFYINVLPLYAGN